MMVYQPFNCTVPHHNCAPKAKGEYRGYLPNLHKICCNIGEGFFLVDIASILGLNKSNTFIFKLDNVLITNL